MIGPIHAKYITFDIKKYGRVTFHMILKNHAQFEEKLACGSQNDMRQAFIRTLENVKIGTFIGSFSPK